MKKNFNVKDILFHIFSTVCIFLSVIVFALLGRLTGDPNTKMLTDLLIIFLLVTLNVTVLFLYENNKKNKK